MIPRKPPACSASHCRLRDRFPTSQVSQRETSIFIHGITGRTIFGDGRRPRVHVQNPAVRAQSLHMSVTRQECRLCTERRMIIGRKHMSMRAEKRTPPVHDNSRSIPARKVEDHLVDFCVAITPHRRYGPRNSVQQRCHRSGIVSFRQRIARAMVKQIAQQHQSVRCLAGSTIQQHPTRFGASMKIRCYDKLHEHSPVPFISQRAISPVRFRALVNLAHCGNDRQAFLGKSHGFKIE